MFSQRRALQARVAEREKLGRSHLPARLAMNARQMRRWIGPVPFKYTIPCFWPVKKMAPSLEYNSLSPLLPNRRIVGPHAEEKQVG
jgi:hypothetical protein